MNQNVRAFGQQRGETNVEKRPHLVEHFFAGNASLCHLESALSRLLGGMVAAHGFSFRHPGGIHSHYDSRPSPDQPSVPSLFRHPRARLEVFLHLERPH